MEGESQALMNQIRELKEAKEGICKESTQRWRSIHGKILQLL